MNKLLKTAAIAIGLAGATLATTGTASARDNQRQQSNAQITISFGDVAYGYRDGYWDNQRDWHQWKHQDDARRFRDSGRGEYHHWNHTRDRNQGWKDGGVTFRFGNVAYGYRDGYWDNQRNWHRWNSQSDAQIYRDSRRGHYRHWDHNRDRNQGWGDRNDRGSDQGRNRRDD